MRTLASSVLPKVASDRRKKGSPTKSEREFASGTGDDDAACAVIAGWPAATAASSTARSVRRRAGREKAENWNVGETVRMVILRVIVRGRKVGTRPRNSGCRRRVAIV